jgi:hypothetical protein
MYSEIKSVGSGEINGLGPAIVRAAEILHARINPRVVNAQTNGVRKKKGVETIVAIGVVHSSLVCRPPMGKRNSIKIHFVLAIVNGY